MENSIAHLGGINVTLGAPGRGITGWSIANLDPATTNIDGLPTTTTAANPSIPQEQTSSPHANGATGIDHVVITTPNFGKLLGLLGNEGLSLRRVVGDAPKRMGFRRLGPAILELVEAPQAPKTAFWGLVIVVQDLDALADRLADHLAPIKSAVQPSRRIATLKPTAGLTPALAFMDPE